MILLNFYSLKLYVWQKYLLNKFLQWLVKIKLYRFQFSKKEQKFASSNFSPNACNSRKGTEWIPHLITINNIYTQKKLQHHTWLRISESSAIMTEKWPQVGESWAMSEPGKPRRLLTEGRPCEPPTSELVVMKWLCLSR